MEKKFKETSIPEDFSKALAKQSILLGPQHAYRMANILFTGVSNYLASVKNYQRKYLLTLKDKTVCDAMFTECDGEHWWNYNYDDVIAWMPLPEPYKEESEEK